MSNASPVTHPRRRIVLVGLGGTGILAAIAAYLGSRVGVSDTAKAPSRASKTSEQAVASSDPLKEEAPLGNAKVMEREWFLPHVKSDFTMQKGALTAATIKLLSVSPAQEITDKDHQRAYTGFSLLFQGPKDELAESRVFRLNHPVLGSMDIFLTPVGLQEKVTQYEAIFTQRV